MGEQLTPATGSSSDPSAVRRRPGFWALASVVARLSIPVMLVLWAVTPPPLPEEVWYQSRHASGADVVVRPDPLGDPPLHVELWAVGRSDAVEALSIDHVANWDMIEEVPLLEGEDEAARADSEHAPAPPMPHTILVLRTAPLQVWFGDRVPVSPAALTRVGWFTSGGPPKRGTRGMGAITAEPIVRDVGRARFVRYGCVEADPPSSLLDALLELF